MRHGAPQTEFCFQSWRAADLLASFGVFTAIPAMTSFAKFLLLGVILTAASARTASAAVAIGQPAPDFFVTDIAGRMHKLSDYRGQTVVLEWHNPDCPIVHKHYDSDNLPKLQRTATADGVIWLLINSGAPGKQGADYTAAEFKAWLKKYHAAPTAYLRDPAGKVGHLYAAKTTPHMFVITADGTLVYDGAIDSIRSADVADVPKAVNYVTAALAAVKAGRPVEKAATQPYGCSVKY